MQISCINCCCGLTLSNIIYLQVPIIAYSVGERGLISQLLCPKFGGFLAYASIDRNSIPGMPSLYSVSHTYKFDSLNSETKVFGLVSKPIGHSKGPLLHNPTFRHENFNGVYVPMFVDNLKEFFSIYSSHDFAGFRYVVLQFHSHTWLIFIFGRLCQVTVLFTVYSHCKLHLFLYIGLSSILA